MNEKQMQAGPAQPAAGRSPGGEGAIGAPPSPPPPVRRGTFGLVRELWLFAGENKKWWLLPMLLVLVLLGVLLFVAASSSIAPFIYTIF